MTKIIFLVVTFIIYSTLGVFAQNTVQLSNDKTKTTITYKLHHPAHEVEATSDALTVKIEYDKDKQQITKAISQVKVTTFDSRNSSRDSHAMEAVESSKYPTTTFKGTGVSYSGNTMKIYGGLTFHGVTKNVTINATQSTNGNTLTIKGSFGISLDDHKVERPTLLFVPTDEYLHFEFNTSFQLN
jgi:polyisoprenoid-binding protein YceI